MSQYTQYPSRRTVLAGVGAGALAALVAACSSSSSSPASSGKSSNSLPGSVGVGTIAPYVEVAVMQQQGFFKKALGGGVGVNFQALLSQVPMQDAIAGGSLDIGQSATPTSAIGQGQPIRIVATFEHNVNGEGLLVRPDGPIKTPADLKGKKIGGASAVPTVQLYETLKSVGLTLHDVTLEALAANVGVAGLVRGAVDAYYAFDPYFTQAIVEGQAVKLDLGASNIEAWIPVIVNSSFLASYPEAVYDYLVAMKESIAWIDANPTQTQQLYATQNKLSIPLTKDILANRVRKLMVPDGNFLAQCEQDGDFQYSYGLIKEKINWSQVIDSSLVDKVLGA